MANITGTSGNDTLNGTSSADSITGSSGTDILYGGLGNDSLYGGTNSDTLVGGGGSDSLYGGSGSDLADYSASGAGVSVNLTTGAGLNGDAQGDIFSSIEYVLGSDFDDTLTGNSSDNILTGGLGNDSLAGGSGDDSLYGGDNADTLTGGSGGDLIDGGAGRDMADYSAATGAVTVNLSTGLGSGSDAGSDTLTGIEDVTGSGNADSLTGNSADNALYGGGGADTLTGGEGADSLDGGSGNDLVSYAASLAGVTVDLATGVGSGGDAAGDTLTGIESLTGSALNDVLTGNTSANLLTGGDGSDLLDGGSGADSLYGGVGNDTLKGGSGSDILSGGTGIDTADYSASATAVNVTVNGTVSGGDAAGDTLSGIENLIGSALNDTLTGDAVSNYLSGGAGRDSLTGGDGDDTLAGGAGIDTLTGGAGLDYIDYSTSSSGVSVNLATGAALYGDAQGDVLAGVDGIIGSAFDDTLVGFDAQGTAPDVYTNIFYGGGGNDVMDGAAANDVLYGGTENDTVLGGTGDDTLSGGDGTDSLLGGDGNDSATGDAGDDILSGDAGNDVLDGGTGNDAVYGGTGVDALSGGDGLDTLDGGDGNDTLIGGAGEDVLYGGAGLDSLVGGAGSDTIYAGAGDTVDGAESGDEFDVINLAGQGPYVIVRDPLNPENGVVNFLDEFGNITGTLTFTNIEQVVSCFTPGTLIVTDTGLRDVASLRVGHLVMTRDHGLQPIRWVGARRIKPLELLVDPSLRPIMIRRGALGCGLPERDMMLSRQHRMLINGPRAELLFGTDEVLVRAAHLTCLPGVHEVEVASVTYVHIMFDQHEVVLADGAWSESFQPGDRSLNGLDGDQRDELLRIFPELAQMDQTHRYDAVRTTLKAHEARVLLSA